MWVRVSHRTRPVVVVVAAFSRPSSVAMELSEPEQLLSSAAAAHDFVGVCGALAAGVSPINTDGCGLTALHLACSSPESVAAISIVAALLSGDGKAVLNVQCRLGCSALMLAAHHGSTSIVQTLIEAGAMLDLQDDGGRTAWTMASGVGHGAVVEALM